MCLAPLWYWLLALLFRAPGGLARLKRLMARGQPLRQAGLRAKAKGKFKAKTEGLAWGHSNHPHPLAKNLLDQQFQAERPNQVWLSDLPYIVRRRVGCISQPCWNGFC